MTVYGEAPKYPAGFQHFDYVNPNAPKGGSLTRSAEEIGQFNYLNPYVDQGINVREVDTWVYSPLAYRSLDEPYTVYGLIAEKMEMDPNGLWIRFFLNPKARFEDGKPVTAQDVRYTFELMTTKASFSYRPMFADVKEVTIEGPLQIRFDFKNNLNRMLALDIASLHILPEHWWKTRDFANGGGFEPPLGNGPYRVAKVDAGRSVTFERVKDWWGKDLPVSRGLYNFDSLTVNYYGDTEIARQLLQAGMFDYNREFSSSGFVVGYSGPAIDDASAKKTSLPSSARSPRRVLCSIWTTRSSRTVACARHCRCCGISTGSTGGSCAISTCASKATFRKATWPPPSCDARRTEDS